MDVFKVKISDIANSSLNLAQTQVYEVGLTPPGLLWVLQTSKLACYLVTPWVSCLSKTFFEHFGYFQLGYYFMTQISSNLHLKHDSRSFFPLEPRFTFLLGNVHLSLSSFCGLFAAVIDLLLGLLLFQTFLEKHLCHRQFYHGLA